jgi:VacB/RNase II family 3'-5' exoribonuclease
VIKGEDIEDKELKRAILDLDTYAKKLRKIRFKNNPLSFKGSEVKFKLDDNNKPIELLFNEQNDANFLIEEFMVLTNMHVCQFIAEKGFKSIHRTHNTPDLKKLEELKKFVSTFGYSLDLSNSDSIKTELNKLLNESIGTVEENIISSLAVKSMAKANYQTENIGHYGLGLKFYVHVTSPIRRYCDLTIHRQLNDILPNNGYI